VNAPQYRHLATEYLLITSIVPSRTDVQTARRGRIDPAYLDELAASIRQTGVMQAILVRPIDGGQYEIVFGEHRWLASQRAGLDTIPATIRELDDTQVLEAQLIENLQRKGLHELDEALGYRDLMKLKQITADDLAKLIGKSRSYVYARTKLLDLCPDAMQALQAGEIDASRALIIARYPSAKIQQRAVEYAKNPRSSFRQFVVELRQMASVELSDAPFSLDDDTIDVEHKVGNLKAWGPTPVCRSCEYNTSTDPELRTAMGADICIHPPCYEAKCKSALSVTRQALESRGVTIHTGDEARPFDPNRWDSEYVDMQGSVDQVVQYDEITEMPDEAEDQTGFEKWDSERKAHEAQTVATVFGKHNLPAEYVELRGRIVQVVKKADLAPIVKKQYGVQIYVPNQITEDDGEAERETPEQRAAREAKEDLARKIDSEYRQRLLLAVAGKIKAPLKKPDLILVAPGYWDDIKYDLGEDAYHIVETIFGACPPPFDKLTEPELLKLLVVLPLLRELDMYQGKGSRTLDLATRYKVDTKKLRATVTAEIKGTAAKAAPAKKNAKK
jgi:ParB/RepB/Spo0J family partition protein